MQPTQIFEVVNLVTNQALGTQSVVVTDNTGLIALGNTILSSQTNTENFLNVLVERIGKTIFSYRRYHSMFDDLLKNDFEWGNIVQKIKVKLVQAEADQSYNLTDGESVDMYKVNKPKATQKLFTSETPWQMHITIQRVHLQEAFLSASNMGRFIDAIFGEVQNSIELAMEGLGRDCLVNYIGEVSDVGARAINVLSVYNTETNASLTVNSAKHDPDFLRWLVGYIKLISTRMTSMTNLFNDGTETRHTPKALQKLYVLSDWETQLETVVQYAAFNKDFVTLNGFKEIPFWQGIQVPHKISVKTAGGKTATVENIVACLFDLEALGTYKNQPWTMTTPMNAAGGYYNTFWHFKKMYFNDLSENFVFFYLAES